MNIASRPWLAKQSINFTNKKIKTKLLTFGGAGSKLIRNCQQKDEAANGLH